MMKLMALVALIHGANAYSACSIPSFSWMMLDEGAGSSMSYALATMGTDVYMGGHTTSAFTLTGPSTTATFTDTDSTTNVYVAKIGADGNPAAIHSIADGSAGGGARFGLISDIQNHGTTKLVVTGYWKGGNLTFQNTEVLQNPRTVSNSFVASVVAATVRCSADCPKP